jgi:hypothetical protein
VAALDLATFLVLHEVRLRGLVERDDDEVLVRLIEHGFVARSSRGVRITASGRDAHTTLARLEPGSEPEDFVRRTYERFLPLNRELIRICNDWQVRPGGVPNDHRDARYDWAVVDRLRTVDERVAPLVNRLARTVERFGEYRPGLRAALAQLDEGKTEWFTSPRCDSYHTVWMRLHEDMLLAIGAERADEPEIGP